MESVAIVDNLQRNESAFLYYNWKPTSSRANTSSINRFVPIFIGHVLHTISEFSTYFLLLLLTQCLMLSRQINK